MAGRADDFDAQLAERGDDRPGLDDLDDNDYAPLQPGLADLDDVDDDDDEDDYPEDASDDEIDLVAAFYREDGKASAIALPKDLANDLDGLVDQLRSIPGDAGALGAVIIDSDFFVLARVRGQKVQVLLSDVGASDDWPIARDSVDFLGEELDDDDEGPLGDFGMLADAGLSEFDLEQLCSDLDADPIDLVTEIVGKLGYGPAFKKVASGFSL